MNQNKIYVGNLSYNATADDLQDYFKQYGNISDVQLISDRETGRSKGFGFITFDTDEMANASLAAHGVEFQGRTMKVSIAKEKRSGGGGGRRHGGNFGNH